MRTTNEIIEAARMGEPCTEEELRLCIISMRSWAIMAHSWHAKIACDKSLPKGVSMMANEKWRQVNVGWNIPVDERVGPNNHYNNPDLQRRKELAKKIWNAAQNDKG